MTESPIKWPHTLNWPWSPTKHRDDSTHLHPEVFVGPEVVITEKLDGGNTCLKGGEVYARSVAGPSRDGWMAMVRKHHAWKTLLRPEQFNGEDLYGIHSITYAPMREQDTFRLFSVLRQSETHWEFVSWDEVQAYAVELDLLTVPELYRGTFDSTEAITKWFDDHLRQPSAIGGPDREGFVIRMARATQNWEMDAAKYIRPKHVQTDQHWTMNWQSCPLISE